MNKWLGRLRSVKAAAMASALGLVLASAAAPAAAQDTLAEARLRKVESEVRALQRQVFPGAGGGRVFAPEIGASGAARPNPAVPASTAVSDLLTPMDTVEGQLARLTAQVEQTTNRLNQLEARVGVATAAAAAATSESVTSGASANPAAPAGSAPTSSAAPATTGNLSAMSGGASAPRPAPAPLPTPAPSAAPPRAATPAATAAPSAQRVAAVRAIEKPATGDAADDDYSYGFRLWEAKFYPEAQQQLKMFVDKYPRHARMSHARNLLGRAYLDDGKPREAATWFLQNYQAEKSGARASDSLLFLAEAMRQLRDTNRACIALSEFSETYAAEASGRLRSQYDATRAGVKCNNAR
jgi:TolA-binding protein